MDLTLIMTEDCNLRCKYCYQKNFRRVEMPLEIANTAVETTLNHTDERLSLTFFGGEPLLMADRIFEVLNHARLLERERGVPITAKVPTNGLLLNQAIIDESAKLGLFISLSFDGVQEAQDAGRVQVSGDGSFVRALSALRMLVQSGHPFSVYSVVTPQNVRFFARSRQFLWDEGVRLFVSALDYTADWNDGAIEELKKQYRLIGKQYRAILHRREHFHFEPFDSRISQHTRPHDWKRCCPGITQVTAAPDGTLYGCVEYFYRRLQPIGSVTGWLSPDYLKEMAQQRAGLPAECQGCGVRERCNNNCACVNLRTTGKANQPPRALCMTEQESLATIDAVAAALFIEKLPEFLLRQYSASYHMLSSIERVLEEMEVGHEHTAAR